MAGFSKKYMILFLMTTSIFLFFLICKWINYLVQYHFIIENFEFGEKLYEKIDYLKPAMPDLGINTWYKTFSEERKLFDARYKPPNLPNMPNYTKRYTLSGIFIDEGPIESNAITYY